MHWQEQQKETEISQEMKQETFLIFDYFTVPLYVWNSAFLAKLFPELNRKKFQVRSNTKKFIKKKTTVTLLAAWLLVLDANGNSLAVYIRVCTSNSCFQYQITYIVEPL